MSKRAAEAWGSLNARQRVYLSTIYEADQAAEEDVKARYGRFDTKPPAAEWRQLTFSIVAPRSLVDYSTIQKTLRERGQHDPGAGSTLAMLARRELITVAADEVEIYPGVLAERVRVRLSTLGRATARHGADPAGTAPGPKRPTGLLGRWGFVTLARLYAAGEAGLGESSDFDCAWEQRLPRPTTVHLLQIRPDGDLTEENNAWDPARNRMKYALRLSARGRRHFDLHHACYRELYPDLFDGTAAKDLRGVPMPEPAQLDEAHQELAAHRARRPAHLLADNDVRLLARLADVHRTDACHWRDRMTRYFTDFDQEVPAEVATMPAGLIPPQIKSVTTSKTSIARLTGHQPAPLAEVVEVPAMGSATLPLAVITPAGLEHLRDHVGEYRALNPELRLGQQA